MSLYVNRIGDDIIISTSLAAINKIAFERQLSAKLLMSSDVSLDVPVHFLCDGDNSNINILSIGNQPPSLYDTHDVWMVTKLIEQDCIYTFKPNVIGYRIVRLKDSDQHSPLICYVADSCKNRIFFSLDRDWCNKIATTIHSFVCSVATRRQGDTLHSHFLVEPRSLCVDDNINSKIDVAQAIQLGHHPVINIIESDNDDRVAVIYTNHVSGFYTEYNSKQSVEECLSRNG